MKTIMLLILSFLAGCSQSNLKTNLSLDISSFFQIQGLPGGVMLYLINKNKNTQRSIAITQEQVSIELLNGNWEFIALGWSGTGPMKGELNCARSPVVKLDGLATTITLSPSTSQCDSDFFSPPNFRFNINGPNKTKPIRLVHCKDTESFSSNSLCTGSSASEAKSFSIKLLSHAELNKPALSNLNGEALVGLNTSCMDASASETQQIRVPSGSDSFNPAIMIETFNEVGCLGRKKSFYFPYGLSKSSINPGNSRVTTLESFVDVRILFDSSPSALPLQSNLMATDGEVLSMVNYNNQIIIGGEFSYVGYPIGSGVGLKASSCSDEACLLSTGQPKVIGTVLASISDGDGGVFIGGKFTHVGGLERKNIAHIKKNGLVNSAFNPGANDDVKSLLLIGENLYVGGSFSSIAGMNQSRLAVLFKSNGAFDTSSSLNTASISEPVKALAYINERLFIGSSMGVKVFYNSTLTSTIMTGDVTSIVVHEGKVYIGGMNIHTTLGVLATIDLSTSAVSIILSASVQFTNYTIPGKVNKFFIHENVLYVGGMFTEIDGKERSNLAAFNISPGGLDIQSNFYFSDVGVVSSLLVSNNKIFVGFEQRFPDAVEPLKNLMAIDISSTADPVIDATFKPNIRGPVFTLELIEGGVFVGGEFRIMGGVRRKDIAAFDSSTGALLAFNPNLGNYNNDEVVRTLIVNGTTLYVGGRFLKMGTFDRKNIAAIDLWSGSGEVLPFNPNANNSVDDMPINYESVNELIIHNNLLYVGGQFQHLGEESRGNIAAVSLTDGSIVLSFEPNKWNSNSVYESINSFAMRGDRLYIGGSFNSVGMFSRKNLAAIHLEPGSYGEVVDLFNPNQENPNSYEAIYSMIIMENVLYVAGGFSQLGLESRKNIAAISFLDNLVLPFNPNVSNPNQYEYIHSLALVNNILYAGGSFKKIGEHNIKNLAGISLGGQVQTGIDYKVDADVHTLFNTNSGSLLLGGMFGSINGSALGGFGVLRP